MPASIRVNNLRIIRSGKIIIPELTFEIDKGQITGILGPSGSGKTTIFRSVVGVQEIASGEISVLDHAAGAAQLRDKIGYQRRAPVSIQT